MLFAKRSPTCKSTWNFEVFRAAGSCIQITNATQKQLKQLFWEALERGWDNMNYSFTLLGWLLSIVLSAAALFLLFIQLLEHRKEIQYPDLACTHTHTHTGKPGWPLQMVSHMEKKPTHRLADAFDSKCQGRAYEFPIGSRRTSKKEIDTHSQWSQESMHTAKENMWCL